MLAALCAHEVGSCKPMEQSLAALDGAGEKRATAMVRGRQDCSIGSTDCSAPPQGSSIAAC